MSRTIALLLALAGCTLAPAETSVEAEQPSPETPAEASSETPAKTAAEAPSSDPPKAPITIIGHATDDQLRAAGACPDLDEGVQPAHVEEVELGGGRAISVVTCETFAYQGTFELWEQQAGAWKPVTDEDRRPVRGLGVPAVAKDGAVTWLEKARGPGDCGDFYELQPGPRGYRVTTHTGRSCDTPVGPGEELADPRTWPSRL